METPQQRLIKDGFKGLYYVVRFSIFVALLYGIDRTPLRPERLVNLFHLGGLGSFILAVGGLLILWWCSGMVFGLFFILGAFIFGWWFVKKPEGDSSEAGAGRISKSSLP